MMKTGLHTMIGGNRKIYLFMAVFVALATFRAEAQLTAATGGGTISADNVASVTYTTLTGPIYDEAATAAVGAGTIILNAPAGFSFDIGGTAPTVLMTRISGTGADSRNINDLASGSSIATTRTASTISCTITAASSNSVRCRLTWQNVRVIPTAGTPLASGNITKTGTSVITGITNSSTNMGTLTEVAGAVASFTFNTISSPQCANSISATITAKDQYGNNAAYTGTAAMTTTAGTVTPATSNAFSGGTLTQTFAVSGSGASQTLTATKSSPTATGTSNAFTINARPNISGTLSVCAGSTTTLTGTGTPHGTTPWASASPSFATVNSSGVVSGIAAGSSVITFMDNNNCSNTETVTVNSTNAVSVSIGASPSGAICAGTNVTFTATPTNGGASPVYQWKLNGGNVGTNSTTYSNNTLVNGDVVTCELTSNVTCASGSPATSNAINMTVNPTNAVSVSIGASPSGAVCAGTNVTFTATPTNSGSSPSYQWRLNGGNVGTNSATYSNNSLANGDIVTCILTSNISCPTGNPATSNAINMTVNPSNSVSVSIGASPSGAICAGANVTFTATPTNGGSSPFYQWKLNGGNVGTNSATYSNNSLANGDIVTCELTSNVSCPTGNPATSNSINMTVNPNLAASVSIAASPSSAICAGANVTFTATPTNGGASPSYQWKVNGNNVGTNSTTYSNNGLANGDVVTCILTSNATCASGSPATSNSINMSVTPTNAVSVSIGASPAGAICAGTNVSFTATPTNGGASPSYQWKLNGGNVGTNSPTYSNNALANGDIVTCVLTSNVSCPTGNPATSNAINMIVNPVLPVSVSVAASPSGAICAGTNVTFTATPTNGGASPAYQWKLNGNDVGTNSATYSNNSLATGDVVSCVLTSNYVCPSGNPATSNSINMTVNPVLPASVSISPSPSSTVCAGTNITFTATPTNGGASPSYQWKLNGSNVGTNSATYSNASLANGNQVSVVMTSNYVCPSGSPATSNTVTMTVNPNNAVSVLIAASPSGAICAGTNVTFTATPTNGGASPVYQWKLNGVNVGTNSATYSNNALTDGDVITCELTSNVSCPTGNPATSNSITMDVNPLPSVTVTPADASVCLGENTVLTATNSGGIADVTFSGTNGTNTTITNSSTAAYTYSSISLSGSGGLSLSDGDVVAVTVTINHDRTADLDIFLVDPSGTRAILLSSDNGGVGGTGYVNTVFRTDASTSITTGTSPMTGTFLPQGNITTSPDRTGAAGGGNYNSVVPANALDGASIDGTWTLRVWDDAGGSGNNNATLDAWSLSIIKKNEYTSVFSGPATISAVNYTGGNGTTAEVTITPPVGVNNYSVTTTDRVGCTATNSTSVTVNALPSASITVAETSGITNNDGVTCSGDNVTLTANPASGMNYSWAAPISATGNNIVVLPTSNTTYTVTVTNSTTSCSATASTAITVNALPTPTIAANETSGTTNNDGTICTGASVTLAVTPATGMNYNWAAPISASGNDQVVNPSSTTGYTVTVTNTTTNCAATANRTVTVNALPTPTMTFTETSGTTNNDATICNGASVTLIANPTTGATYAWAAPVGGTTNNRVVTPTSTTTYTVSVTQTSTGCMASANGTVTVNPLPTPTITVAENSGTTNNDGITCAGGSVTLTANPATGATYSWAAPISATGNNQIVSPTATTNYTVSVTETTTNCMAAVTQAVTVNALPTPTIAANETSGTTNNDGTICTGASVTLAVTPATGMNYNWAAPISASGNDRVVSPTTTTAYTVTVTNTSTNCAATANRTVTVNALPTPTITFTETSGTTNNDGTICNGASVTLIANPTTGATYAWAAPVGGTTNNRVVTPTSTTTYTVSVTQTSTGCMASANGTVTVNPLPTPTITVAENSGVTANDNIICNGGSATLTANPVTGMNYTWAAPVGGTGNNKVVSPTSNTNYNVTVTNASTGCFASATATVTVQTMPTFSVHPVGASLCLGQPFAMNITASGTAITRQWYQNGNPISGATTNNYSVASSSTTDAGNYHVEISNSCAVVSSNTATINLTAPVSPPYAENFESITAPNQLPGCMTATNLGTNTFTRTYGGVGAHSGFKFGSWGPNVTNQWFFTPGIYLPAGIPYEFNYWYWSDNTSAFTSINAAVGTSPQASSMTTQVGVLLSGNALGPTMDYQQYNGVFTPVSDGVYYFGVRVTTNPGTTADKVVIDDIGLVLACTGTPDAGTAHASNTCVNSGNTTSLSLNGFESGVGGIRFQWQSSPKGTNSWTNISGATDSLYTATVNVSTDYRCVITCIHSGQSSNSTAVTVNVNPTAFNVSGGACAPVNIGVSGSQVGVSYQIILNGNVHSTPPVMGTGAPISFGSQVDSGIYAVLATDISTGCTRMMTGVATVAYCTTTWIGVTDSLWTTLTNWDPPAVPNNCYVNVVINTNTSHSPVISMTDIYVRNISLASGVTLNLNGQNLHVCGNWVGGTSTSAMVVGNGTVHLAGQSGLQNIVGVTRFDTLQINHNGQGVKMVSGADVSINGGLHLEHGNLNVSAGMLTLLSKSATHHAYIDDFTFGFDGTISGNIRAQRFIPVSGSNQHFMSVPLSGVSLSQIGASGPDNTYVVPTQDCDEGNSAQNSPYGTCFVYIDGRMGPNRCMLGNWMIKSQGNMVVGKGYSTYQNGNTTLTVEGTANTGDINVGGQRNSGYPTVNTKQLQPIESGWNLVGNPYPSSIDLTIDRTADGFQNQVQVWKATGRNTGTWEPMMITGVPGTVVIPPFQAFMVRVIPGAVGYNHTYRFYQSERVRDNSKRFYNTGADHSLALELTYGTNQSDQTRIEFNADASTDFDDKLDANKPASSIGTPTFYSHMNTNLWYGINSLPSLKQTTTVPVGLRAEMNGAMKISAKGIQTFDPTTYIYLEDKKTGAWHNLRNGDYNFNAARTDNFNRFVVHFTPPAQIMTSDAGCNSPGMIQIEQPGSANWSYTLENQNNVVVSSGTLNAGSSIVLSANAGTYLLTLNDNNGYTVMKHIHVTGSQPIVAAFQASHTAAVPNEQIVFTSTTANAATYQWDFGDGAVGSGENTTHSFFNEGIYNVQLTVTNDVGCSSVAQQTVTVAANAATSLNSIVANRIDIWSSENTVYVDFTKETKVDAEIDMYNVMGQLISREHFNRSAVYSKELYNMAAAYVIVKVMNEDQTNTKKVFIAK